MAIVTASREEFQYLRYGDRSEQPDLYSASKFYSKSYIKRLRVSALTRGIISVLNYGISICFCQDKELSISTVFESQKHLRS